MRNDPTAVVFLGIAALCGLVVLSPGRAHAEDNEAGQLQWQPIPAAQQASSASHEASSFAPDSVAPIAGEVAVPSNVNSGAPDAGAVRSDENTIRRIGSSRRDDYFSNDGGQGEPAAEEMPCGGGAAPGGPTMCDDPAWDGCSSPYGRCCCPLGHLEARGDWMLGWAKGDHMPALVTTSGGTEQTAPGVLPNAVVLFGDSNLNNEVRSGGGATVDYWLGPCQFAAIEVSYLNLGDHTDSFAATSQATSVVARPFYNVVLGQQDSSPVGSVAMSESTDFQSAGVLFRRTCLQEACTRFDLLVGYRYVRLADDFEANDATNFLGATLTSFDRFRTLNEFNGADLGCDVQWHQGGTSLELLMKLGLGNTRSHALVYGTSTVSATGQTSVTYPGGLLAEPTNTGNYSMNALTTIPELGITAGYDLTCRLRFTAGYSLIYWSSVARAGGQIDTDINPTQFTGGTLSGVARPQFQFNMTDYWVQGVSLGLDYHF
jgi:hypothetical protein